MVGGLAGMGLEAGAAATATTPASEAAMQTAINNGTYQNAVGAGASSFGDMFASKPLEALSAAGGGSGYKAAGILGAAAAPIIADEMVETTTEAPPQDRGKIRPYTTKTSKETWVPKSAGTSTIRTQPVTPTLLRAVA
jgi:hypothetical protein